MKTNENNHQRLAAHLLQWHGSAGSYIYQLGSHWMGDHEVGKDVILGAIGEIDRDIALYVTRWGGTVYTKEVKELQELKEKIYRATKAPYETVVVRDGEGTCAVVKALARLNLCNDYAFIQAVRNAVTNWVKNCTDGEKAYNISSEDFNVGDLISYLDSNELKKFLRIEGVYSLDIKTFSSNRQNNFWVYDTQLVKDEDLGDFLDDEDGTSGQDRESYSDNQDRRSYVSK